jgi:hypothetical protein
VYTSTSNVLPAGTYIVQANVAFGHNSVGGPDITCNMVVANATFTTTFLQSGASTSEQYQTISLVAGGTIAASGTIRVRCTASGNGQSALHTAVTAIQTTTWTTLGSN